MVDFIYIGPDKSGSTWIFEFLFAHQDVYIPVAKDLYFFDQNFSKGVDWYEGFYERSEAAGRLKGEVCHDYLFCSLAAERIKGYNDKIRLITSLREPAERSFSQYLYLRKMGLIEGDFRDACLVHPAIVENSLYGKWLSKYLETFEREQVLILDFDELKSAPKSYSTQVLKFLGLSDVEYDVGAQIRSANVPRFALVSKLGKKVALLLRKFGLVTLLGVLKRSPIVERFFFVSSPTSERISAADRDWLYQRYFSADIDILATNIDDRFIKWKR